MAARVARGWSPEQLSRATREQLGDDYAVSGTTIRNLESGRYTRPHLRTIHALATVLGLAREARS
ncbi:MAG: helix-turn-helix transcriptional regulator [Patulibacter sp.]